MVVPTGTIPGDEPVLSPGGDNTAYIVSRIVTSPVTALRGDILRVPHPPLASETRLAAPPHEKALRTLRDDPVGAR
eukprot:4879021-Pyramimonas_sp.AAC.2